jgi:hypothetical protein
MQHDPGDGHRVPPDIGKSNVTFGTNDSARAMRDDAGSVRVEAADARLETKAKRLLDLAKEREKYFRRSVMADSTMSVMLSLFLAELKAVPLTEATLALINLLEGDEGRGVVESLIHAGLVVVTGENPERRTVGLTPLGSARMRSFISDYPDI